MATIRSKNCFSKKLWYTTNICDTMSVMVNKVKLINHLVSRLELTLSLSYLWIYWVTFSSHSFNFIKT